MSVNLKLTFGQKVPNVEYTTTQLAVLLTKERVLSFSICRSRTLLVSSRKRQA